MSQANIEATERQYRTLRHVPPNMSTFQVHAQRHSQFDPEHDESTINAEVERVLTGVRYALQINAAIKPTVYCASQEVLKRVRESLTETEQSKVVLEVGT